MDKKLEKLTLFRFPMAHSFSPFIHSEFGKQFGIELEYTITEANPGHLKQAVEHFRQQNGLGANVTMPHKEEAYALCQKVTPRCEEARSANTLFWQNGELWGDNTDGIGLVRDITLNHHLALKDKVICILGAGGAAAGIVGPLLAQEPKKVLVCNRTLPRAQSLCDRFKHHPVVPEAINFDELNAFAQTNQIDWIINSTPSTSESTVLPLQNSVANKARIYELAYSKDGKVSPFASWAKHHGAIETFDGLGMLVEQAAESFAVWHDGKHPDTKEVIAKLRK